jgi:hypothetical protein
MPQHLRNLPVKIYVASSWRNDYQPDVVRGLREMDHEVYDFRNPEAGDQGFHWLEIDAKWESWSLAEYIAGLRHPLASAGFGKDFAAMQRADACVLVLPCGRSAHLEAGWFVGNFKPLLILVEQIEPELMYKMADSIHKGLGSLLLRLQEIEDS